uniref:NADH-ubiquinone oxidoreductase chain 6 n=1 Tax=Mecysmoderes ater TaxID=3158840 RepID=A0AAU7GJV4_9CUCU
MLMYLLTMNLMMSIMFIFLNHPMSLGSMLLIQTLLMALISGQLFMNYWFSYILFLIMIGGMLVMFIYMTSIASNEKFKYSNLLLIMFLTIMLLTMFLFFMMDNLYLYMINFINSFNFNKLNFSLNKLYNYPNNQIILFLMSYLLITLIAVVKMVGKYTGALRQK